MTSRGTVRFKEKSRLAKVGPLTDTLPARNLQHLLLPSLFLVINGIIRAAITGTDIELLLGSSRGNNFCTKSYGGPIWSVKHQPIGREVRTFGKLHSS